MGIDRLQLNEPLGKQPEPDAIARNLSKRIYNFGHLAEGGEFIDHASDRGARGGGPRRPPSLIMAR